MKNVEDIRFKANNYMKKELKEPYAGETTVLHYLEVLRDKIGFDAVSYTHLDVYKRQVYCRCGWKCTEGFYYIPWAY